MSNIILGVFQKNYRFWLCENYMNGVCCLLIAYGIYVGAYCIRPVCHRSSHIAQTSQTTTDAPQKPYNSGRMQYVPTAVQFFYWMNFTISCNYYACQNHPTNGGQPCCFVQLSPMTGSEVVSVLYKNLSILTFFDGVRLSEHKWRWPLIAISYTFSLVSKRDYYPHSISWRHMGVVCFCGNCESRLALADFLNFCVRRSWIDVLCVFEKIQHKGSKTFLNTLQDFRQKVQFPPFFLFYPFPFFHTTSITQHNAVFYIKRGWQIAPRPRKKAKKNCGENSVNKINSYICNGLTLVSAFAKHNIYDTI